MAEKDKICDSYCYRCAHYSSYFKCCDYVFNEDKLRGCDPGTGCDKKVSRSEYLKRVKEKKPITIKTPRERKPQRNTREKGFLSFEENERRFRMYRDGFSDAQIARVCDVDKTTITKWRKVRKLPRNHDDYNRVITHNNLGNT